MTGDTILFRRGSSFEWQGQMKDDAGAPQSLVGVNLGIFETMGAGAQEIQIAPVDAPTGKFKVTLSSEEAAKLPLGRSSWFKIMFIYVDTAVRTVFPPIWLDVQ